MHVRSRAVSLCALLLVAAFAGCAERTPVDPRATIDPPTPTPPPPETHFVIEDLAIIAPDGEDRVLREDDGNATIRYVVKLPADAPGREAAFVTYLFNGTIVDVQQITLSPGEVRVFERAIALPNTPTRFDVEIRAGSAVAKHEGAIVPWPQAGRDALDVGPLRLRADYGLLRQDGDAIVNITVENVGNAEVWDFRVKMLCTDATGKVTPTESVVLEAPAPGQRGAYDAVLRDCWHTAYGLQVRATGPTADEIGRILF